jgi:arylsulfatase A-like enzyme
MAAKPLLRILSLLVIATQCANIAVAEDRPNILLIITDQQSATMMSCAGNAWLDTPAMDGLSVSGVRFEKAYAANPVCVPSRFSLLSGRYPTEIGMRYNQSRPLSGTERIVGEAAGHVLLRAGYETVYGGKVHLPGAMKKIEDCGFTNITDDQRDELAVVCADYLSQKHDKPFFLLASFINPHDICYMAIMAEGSTTRPGPQPIFGAMKLPDGVSEDDFYATMCPPLPDNFEPSRGEPSAYDALLRQRAFRQHVRDEWTERDWRLHRYAYCRLTERVDAQIGIVMDALDESENAQDTIVIFTSDHGDNDAAHRMEHKTTFYEEAARIPMIIRDPRNGKQDVVDAEHLVSNGLDMLPTLCDYSGAELPAGLHGRSLRPLIDANSTRKVEWRDAVLVENEVGDMVYDGRYKYCEFLEGEINVALFDMQTDPGEMTNLAIDPTTEYAVIIARLKVRLEELRTERTLVE